MIHCLNHSVQQQEHQHQPFQQEQLQQQHTATESSANKCVHKAFAPSLSMASPSLLCNPDMSSHEPDEPNNVVLTDGNAFAKSNQQMNAFQNYENNSSTDNGIVDCKNVKILRKDTATDMKNEQNNKMRDINNGHKNKDDNHENIKNSTGQSEERVENLLAKAVSSALIQEQIEKQLKTIVRIHANDICTERALDIHSEKKTFKKRSNRSIKHGKIKNRQDIDQKSLRGSFITDEGEETEVSEIDSDEEQSPTMDSLRKHILNDWNVIISNYKWKWDWLDLKFNQLENELAETDELLEQFKLEKNLESQRSLFNLSENQTSISISSQQKQQQQKQQQQQQQHTRTQQQQQQQPLPTKATTITTSTTTTTTTTSTTEKTGIPISNENISSLTSNSSISIDPTISSQIPISQLAPSYISSSSKPPITSTIPTQSSTSITSSSNSNTTHPSLTSSTSGITLDSSSSLKKNHIINSSNQIITRKIINCRSYPPEKRREDIIRHPLFSPDPRVIRKILHNEETFSEEEILSSFNIFSDEYTITKKGRILRRKPKNLSLSIPLNQAHSGPSSSSTTTTTTAKTSSRHKKGFPTPNSRYSRKRDEYDINDYIVPWGSIVGGATIPDIKPKEIFTPTWREINSSDYPSTANDIETMETSDEETTNHNMNDDNDDSDMLYCKLHLPLEIDERRRTLAFLTSNSSRRNRKKDSGNHSSSSTPRSATISGNITDLFVHHPDMTSPSTPTPRTPQSSSSKVLSLKPSALSDKETSIHRQLLVTEESYIPADFPAPKDICGNYEDLRRIHLERLAEEEEEEEEEETCKVHSLTPRNGSNSKSFRFSSISDDYLTGDIDSLSEEEAMSYALEDEEYLMYDDHEFEMDGPRKRKNKRKRNVNHTNNYSTHHKRSRYAKQLVASSDYEYSDVEESSDVEEHEESQYHPFFDPSTQSVKLIKHEGLVLVFQKAEKPESRYW